MEQVALTLQKWAIERKGVPDDFDKFGRSAFNRYYYSTFLIVRSFILEFEPGWKAAHSSLPEMLRGSVRREISQFRSAALRRGQREEVSLCDRGILSLAALASLMEEANKTRVVADYNPDISVKIDQDNRFNLGSSSINDAHDWPGQARLQIGFIKRAWRLSRGIV